MKNKIKINKNKNRQHIKLLQMFEWNTAKESAHTETGDKAFQAGTVPTKKEYLYAFMVDK